MTKAIESNIKGEWSRELNVEFIADYKRLRVIWDASMRHLKSDRVQAVKSLCEKYQLNPDEVRGRIKILRTSFHREHIKVLKSANTDEVYVPKWYGYELMRFIVENDAKDQKKIKNEIDESFHISDATIFDINFSNYEQYKHNECEEQNSIIHNEAIENELPGNIESNINETVFKSPGEGDNRMENILKSIEEKPEEITIKCDNILGNSKDSLELNNENLDSSTNHIQIDSDQITPTQPPCKRIKISMPNIWEKNFSSASCCNCHCNNHNRGKDEFLVFGENVAVTLQNLKNEKSRIIAKHMINNILFEAQMGKYDQ